MKIGYARVSTEDQQLTFQLQALKEAGCKKIYQEKVSGDHGERKELGKMLENLRENDGIIVWRLDRLARSTQKLLEIADKIHQAGAHFRSISEPWADTISSAGRMVMTVFAGIAEFEKELIIERTSRGRHSAKERGVKFGRLSKLNPEQKNLASRLFSEGKSIKQIAKTLNVHSSTLYRNLEIQS
ncbi:recombinase family protein [Candidatus Finniella inopinata]|uniref:Recombinase family protein n=1 Tax=Candidatus Finniella inopinata TaxID=1696036 RepID=A0A4Q7DGG7_9PROT|nr:recombinase family protein [Candidatus Finniella inopinata]RZI45235.1 recombinase family protein [Candidatus Finniella inopinata]